MRSSPSLVASAALLMATLALALALVGCRGKEIATAQLHGPGSAEITFPSTGAPLTLWADTVGKWHGGGNSRFAAHYEIDVMAGANKLGHVTCDTKDARKSVCGVKTSNGDEHSGDCEIGLDCQLPPLPAGPVTLKVTGSLGAGTSDVTNMSINVRAK
jgi:hypothetical protein